MKKINVKYVKVVMLIVIISFNNFIIIVDNKNLSDRSFTDFKVGRLKIPASACEPFPPPLAFCSPRIESSKRSAVSLS